MSLYAELRRGPVRAWSSRPERSRTNDIYSRLNRSRRNRTTEAANNYNREARRRPRASTRDMQFEKRKLKADKKAQIQIDAMEKEIDEEEEKNRMEENKIEELKKTILMVEKTDLHVNDNTTDHHTDMFDCTDDLFPQLVVRRGQEFKITFTFQRPWSGKQDNLYLNFKLGDNPNVGKGTQIKVKMEEGNDTSYMNGSRKKWGARILEQKDNALTVSVFTPPNAIIGQWEYSVMTEFVEGGKKKKCQLEAKDDIIVILNPWCKDDQVYMEDEVGLNEYILNECGCVFNGNYRGIGKKSWFYGQFQENILDISLHLLRKAFDYEISNKMSDPIHISRGLSKIMNDCDDNGVLSGNWSGNYEGGIRPTSWKGSVPILLQYDEDKEPVKFGQCWVFSHLLTTVARALGLPCRSVTNFSSAHDTNLSMTIDKFLDDEGDVIKWKTRDSVWNFHVWNEVWIHRPDLDKLINAEGKYDGWHAIDATPQETSDNVYQCGPSPLAAIRCGDVHIGYDTKFIFAEVNGEVCSWRESCGDLTLVNRNSNSVGKSISTKNPNGDAMNSSFFASDEDNRLDITHLYKHPEGSVAEREAVMRALSGTDVHDLIFTNVTGIEIEIMEMPEPKLGEDITATIKVMNKASETRSVGLKAVVRPMTYWGEVIGTKLVASHIFREGKIEPNEFKTYELVIKANSYIDNCDEQMSMSILAMGSIRDFDDHQNRVYGSDDFKVKTGVIEVQGPTETVTAEETIELQLKFDNPTSKTLTNCHIEIEGGVEVMDSSFKKKHAVFRKNIKDIKPHESMSMNVMVKPHKKPRKCPHREVDVGFVCDELPDFEGALDLKLRK